MDQGDKMIKLHHAEALEWFKRLDRKTEWDMIFMDPPDNIGLDYGNNDSRLFDHKPSTEYYNWLRSIIRESMSHGDKIWISYNNKHDFEIKSIIRDLIRGRRWAARTFIWHFNFGQYRETDCPNCFRPIIRLSRDEVEWHFPKEVRVESERMRLRDSRACGVKVPGDVWHYPRITGNHPERRKWCPTQHPEALLERIVRISVDKVKDGKVLELFTGSGTMIRVAKRIKIELDTVELSGEYCKHLIEEHPKVRLI